MRLHLSTGKCPGPRASEQIAHVLAKLEYFFSLILFLSLCFSVQVYSETSLGFFFFPLVYPDALHEQCSLLIIFEPLLCHMVLVTGRQWCLCCTLLPIPKWVKDDGNSESTNSIVQSPENMTVICWISANLILTAMVTVMRSIKFLVHKSQIL